MNVIGGYRTAFDNLPIYYHFLSKPIYLKGMIAYLSDPQPSNYYHWMCGTLPLLRTYQSYLDLDAIDYFYVGQFHLTGFHQESLARIGININRVIQKACTADRMLAAITTRFVQLNDPISREAFFFTRNLFADVVTQHSSSPRTRIYVERGNVSRRRVINEDQILALLKKYDFEPVTMDGKSVSEQAEIFSRAEAIVAPHGAALTNLLFVQPYTTVIELLPEGYINNCFFVVASYAESNYFYLQGESTTTSHLNAHSLDLQIDIQKLEKLCRMAAL
jgi:capsular polysaccharide biosynthesis protein